MTSSLGRRNMAITSLGTTLGNDRRLPADPFCAVPLSL